MKIVKIKIKEGNYNGPGCYSLKKDVNISDYKQVALLLFDLESNGANVDKAFREFQEMRQKGFPF